MSSISGIVGDPQARDEDCDLIISSASTDDEKFGVCNVPIINIETITTTIVDDFNEMRDLEKVTDSYQILDRAVLKYRNDDHSPSSSTCESTDCNVHVGTRKKLSKPPSRELLQRVSELVEYYLSDENLVNDMFLLKHVTKHKEGYVSLKLLANYKKLKRVRKDWNVLVAALKNSSKLEVSPEGTKVRRRVCLPPVLEEDTRQLRSLLGHDIPDQMATIQKMAEIFGKFGEIDSIQMHKPYGRSVPEIHLAELENPGIVNTLCCLVTYDKVHSARQALKFLDNNTECPVKVADIPRRKFSSNGKLEVNPSCREYESAYFSAPDFEDPESHFLSRYPNIYSSLSRKLAATNNWREHCNSSSSSTYSLKPRSTVNDASSISSTDDHWRSHIVLCNEAKSRKKYYQAMPNPPSPLPRQLLPITRPLPTPPNSPNPSRRFQNHMQQQASSAPNSPWTMRRNNFIRSNENNGSNDCWFQCPRVSSPPENIVRIPRGPDGTKGFGVRGAGLG